MQSTDGATRLAGSSLLAELTELRYRELLLYGLPQRLAFGEGDPNIARVWARSISMKPHQPDAAHRRPFTAVELKNDRASHSAC